MPPPPRRGPLRRWYARDNREVPPRSHTTTTTTGGRRLRGRLLVTPGVADTRESGHDDAGDWEPTDPASRTYSEKVRVLAHSTTSFVAEIIVAVFQGPSSEEEAATS